MIDKIRIRMNHKFSAEQKLKLQLGVVILLCLLTMSVMSGYMDQNRVPQDTASSAETAAGSPADGGDAPVTGDSPADGGDAAVTSDSSAEGGDAAVTGDSPSGSGGTAVSGTVQEGIIRFHVIANSDSEADQELKLEVRNQVLARLQTRLAEQVSREMTRMEEMELTEEQRLALTRSFIAENLNQIEIWAEDAITAEGFGYPVKATLGITWIPDREYDGIYFPSGNYEALNLVIGEGKGQNWWCVIFPPLCLIDSSEKLRTQLGEARFEAWLDSQGGSRIILKSKIKELLEKNES